MALEVELFIDRPHFIVVVVVVALIKAITFLFVSIVLCVFSVITATYAMQVHCMLENSY